ncbi:MAG: serine/threonine protein kinase [Acidobacteria bacterium]|nr:serine/threonine protein kinase [Acidobacteriota bacterium]
MSSNTRVDLDWLALQFPDLTNLQGLAAGGQKQVFAARHAADGEVVLKLMHPGADPARTERELEAATKVQAPRMPRIFERGQLTGNTGMIVWFREQRIPGETLSARIQASTLSHHELLRLALHVSETLVAAEAVGIVHRDVKPANIILDPHGEFWLIDFGVARHLDLESLTATAAPGGCGTIGYAPAEQCRNDKPNIDARADLFALGVTLYEAATGRNPHVEGARDRFEVIRRASTQQLPRLGGPLPADFADLVATLAQPNLVHRCQTAQEAHDWIKDLCDREGVQ